MLLRSGWIASLLAIGGGAGCDEAAPDGTGLVVEILAEQPRSTDLGVSLAIHARGGGSVYLSVEQGTFLTDAEAVGSRPTAQTTGCVSGGTEQALFSFALSVRPSTAEALLFAALRAGHDCTGDIVQSRLVAIRPPTVNPTPDAGAPAEEAP